MQHMPSPNPLSPDAAGLTAPRLQGLDNEAIRNVVATAQALGLGRADQAAMRLAPVLLSHPQHPEVLRLRAGILSLRGEHSKARTAIEQAVEFRPMDALYHNTLGTVLGATGDFDAAIRALHRACELQPGLSSAWYNLGVMLTRCVRNEEAAEALRHAAQLAPENMDARALLADLLRMRGDVEASAVEYRKILSERSWAGMAWWGLADLRTGLLTSEDLERMRAALRDSRATDDDRIATGFALAKALDEQARYRESLDELKRANAIARLRQRWNARAFSAGVNAINAAFDPLPAGATDAGLGQEVIFVVGVPRSGTTLAEQILASHSRVAGAGELLDLPQVLAEESRRRNVASPGWVAQMNPADWQRLGERYLERTARWTKQRPVFVDKLPNNWMHVGAIRAMLPGARIVACRRDPLETCFSCYRQHLAGNEYTRTPEDLVAFWRDFDRTATHWAHVCPMHVYQHEYETLQANPDQAIRRLLDFCGLPFEQACLNFHETIREVRSPSATQVRRPLGSDTARADQYGELLDPFRALLGRPLSGT